MTETSPIDYQTALEQFRKEEHAPDHPVRSPDRVASLPMMNGFVDYQAAVRAWDRAQAGKYVMYNAEQKDEGR